MTGGVLRLDGIDDYVQFDSHLVPHSGAFSVSFFAKRAGEQGGGHIEWISQGSSGAPGFYIGYHYYSDGATNYIRITDNHSGSSNPSFPTDLLQHHVAVTTDGNNTWYYLDGVLNTTLTGGCPTTTTGTHTRFGRQFGSNGEYFHGDIDEMRIFSGTLDACDVATLAGMGPDCDSNGLIDCNEIILDPSLDCDGDMGLDSCQIALDPSLDWDGNGVLDSCTGGGPGYCFGNINAAGNMGSIEAAGSPLIVDNNLTLSSHNLPINQPGYYLFSANSAYVNPFGGGAGVLCLGAPIRRLNHLAGYPVLFVNATGDVSLTLDLGNLPGTILAPGDIYIFQLWHREYDPATGNPTSNTTDSMRLMFR